MRTLVVTVLSVVVLAAGCSTGSLPVVDDLSYDSTRARELLVTVLDAWKHGRAVQLRRRDPPIRFADDDWAAGWQLVDYEIDDRAFPLRPFKSIEVKLTLRDRQGKTVHRSAAYQVVLDRRPAVLRTDT